MQPSERPIEIVHNQIQRADDKLRWKIPANREAERAVLALSVSGVTESEWEVLCTITEDHFYYESHRRCWRVIDRILEKERTPDMMLFASEARKFDNSDDLIGTIDAIFDQFDEYGKSSQTIPLCDWVQELNEFLTLRTVHQLCYKGLLETNNGARQDVASFAEQFRTKVEDATTEEAEEDTRVSHLVEDAISSVADGENRRVIETPWDDFNDKLAWGGLRDEYFILGARPSMGKTSLSLNCILGAAGQGLPCLFVSLETSKNQIILNLLSMLSGISATRLRRWYLNPPEGKELQRINNAKQKLQQFPIWIVDDTFQTYRIVQKIRWYHSTHNIRFAVVDYLQKIDHADNDNENHTISVGKTSEQLARLTTQLDIPIMVLSQLSRKCENRGNKRPRLSDLRESGNIEQDADIAAFLYRESYYNKNHPSDDTEVIIAKQKVGPTGTVVLGFEPERLTFTPRSYNTHTSDESSSSGGYGDYNQQSRY